MDQVYVVMIENLAVEYQSREIDSIFERRDAAMARVREARADQEAEDIQAAFFVEEWDVRR